MERFVRTIKLSLVLFGFLSLILFSAHAQRGQGVHAHAHDEYHGEYPMAPNLNKDDRGEFSENVRIDVHAITNDIETKFGKRDKELADRLIKRLDDIYNPKNSRADREDQIEQLKETWDNKAERNKLIRSLDYLSHSVQEGNKNGLNHWAQGYVPPADDSVYGDLDDEDGGKFGHHGYHPQVDSRMPSREEWERDEGRVEPRVEPIDVPRSDERI